MEVVSNPHQGRIFQGMPDSFLDQRYPTVEETLTSNASLLYKQKKQFLAHFRSAMAATGYVVIGLVYLRDVTLTLFIGRVLVQYLLAHPFVTTAHFAMLRDNAKSEQRLFLLRTMGMVNAASVLSHLFYGPYRWSRAVDRQLHGGLTIQFIGESLPLSRLALLAYDALITALQVTFFCLMCATDDLEVLHAVRPSSSEEAVSSHVLSDGFNGNVFLVTIDVGQALRTLWNYDSASAEYQAEAALHSERAHQGMYV